MGRPRGLLILVLFAALVTRASPSLAEMVAATAARAAQHDAITRFVIELSDDVHFSVPPGSNPRELAVDLPELDWHDVDGRVLGRGVGLLTKFTYAVTTPGHGRLMLETATPAAVKTAFVIPPAAGSRYRLVIDLQPASNAMPAPLPVPAPTATIPAPAAPAAQQAALVTPPQPQEHRPHPGNPIVVIDPGHGGVDPGATSVTGAYEKNIVLALAHDVKDLLDKDGKVTCLLTRDRDVFIPLRERVAIARSENADLFVSLHADIVADPDIRGLSVYTLSQNASDTEAQALADKENKADIVAGIDLSNESAEVTNILIDLVQRESMNRSAGFAHMVITEVNRETHQLLQNTHRFAGFAVLKAPDIPSVLVESGYLSNPRDEQMLRQPEHRAKLAAALARAIELYFARPHAKARPS